MKKANVSWTAKSSRISLSITCIAGALAASLPAFSFAQSGAGPSASCLMDGDLDPTFGTNGKVTTDFGTIVDEARGVVLQADGKIVAAGATVGGNFFDFALARYNTDGSLDTTFGTGGKVTTAFNTNNDEAFAVALQADGKIVAAGSAVIGGADDFALARYNTDGSLDTTFGTGGKVTTAFGSSIDEAHAVVVQPDGKIVAAGVAVIGSGSFDFALARYNTDGSLDTTFGTGGKVTTAFGSSNDEIFAVALQPDGKIVAAGRSFSSKYDFALARYNTNGSLDTTFDTDGKVTTNFNLGGFDAAYAVALQLDGKIVAAGTVQIGTTFTDFGLARYNTNGSLDTTFGAGGKVTTAFGTADDEAFALAVQPTGKIVAAGSALISGAFQFALARYNTDGSLDNTFDTDGKLTTAFGSNEDRALAVALQPDGKIVAAGFADIGGSFDFALARYGACPPAALQLTAAVSRKTHGGAGTFDISLPLSGEPGVEDRSTGGSYTLVFSFSADVISGNASVTSGTGSVSGSPVFAGNTMTVNLTGVTDVQQITVTLTDVTSSDSQVLPDTSVSMNVLIGDATADKTVTNRDVRITKGQIGIAVTAANFREDVNASGSISTADVRLVRGALGHSLP